MRKLASASIALAVVGFVVLAMTGHLGRLADHLRPPAERIHDPVADVLDRIAAGWSLASLPDSFSNQTEGGAQ